MSTNKESVITKNTMYALYYIVLLLLTFFLTKPDVSYSAMVRYAYILAVVTPLFFNKSYAIFALPLFLGISYASFAPFFPTNSLFCFIVCIALSIMQVRIRYGTIIYLIWIIYLLCVELLTPVPHFECIMSGVTTIFLSFLVNTKHDITKIGIAFGLISFVLSLLFLLYFDKFSEEFLLQGGDDVERASWINPNIFGGIIGCGMVSMVLMLVQAREMSVSRWIKFLCFCGVLLSIMTLILNASRGALVASILSSLILLFNSKIQYQYKWLSLAVILIFIVILYNEGYFELLNVRLFEEETIGTAGGRTEIWSQKLEAFSNLPIAQQFFGVGYNGCVNMGIYFDTHNDFITAICAYGYIGFISFIALSIAPIFIASKEKKMIVAGLLLFFILENVVLSPVFRGYFIFFIFYLMVLKYAIITSEQKVDIKMG